MDNTRDLTIIWTIFGTLMVLGFLAGAARAKLPRGPYIAAFAIIIGYVALLVVTGGWVAACPGCTSHISYDSSRAIDLMAAILWGGAFTFSILLFILLGGGVSSFVQWLLNRRA